jgi:hypothetical protein
VNVQRNYGTYGIHGKDPLLSVYSVYSVYSVVSLPVPMSCGPIYAVSGPIAAVWCNLKTEVTGARSNSAPAPLTSHQTTHTQPFSRSTQVYVPLIWEKKWLQAGKRNNGTDGRL